MVVRGLFLGHQVLVDVCVFFFIRAKRVSNCFIKKKKVCAGVRLILVLVWYVFCTRYECTWFQPAEMRWGTER